MDRPISTDAGIGPLYGVELFDTLPLGSDPNGMIQQMPHADELRQVAKRFPRVVAAYEVLTAKYRKALHDLDTAGTEPAAGVKEAPA